MLLLLTLVALSAWIALEFWRYRRLRRLRQDWEARLRAHQERAVQAHCHPHTGHVQHLGPR